MKTKWIRTIHKGSQLIWNIHIEHSSSRKNTNPDHPWIQLLNLCLKVRIFRWDIQMKSYKKLSSYHHWPDKRKRFVCIISMRSWWNNMTIHSFIKTNRIIQTKVMIVVWISIMARYKKQYAPSITGQGISTVVLLYKERAFRRHKDNTKSGHIHRRRTFSPTDISPVLQMMDIQVVGE